MTIYTTLDSRFKLCYTENMDDDKQKMIEVVGSCINETLEEYSKKKCDLSNHDTRIDIAMDTLDKILFIIEKPKFEGPHDPGDENDNPKTKKTS